MYYLYKLHKSKIWSVGALSNALAKYSAPLSAIPHCPKFKRLIGFLQIKFAKAFAPSGPIGLLSRYINIIG